MHKLMHKKNGERQHPRIPVPGNVKCRFVPAWNVQLIDISLGGARLEHLGLLKPGGVSRLVISHTKIEVELPCKVVWSKVIGSKDVGGTRELLCQSGVKFQGLNNEKEASLARLLESFASHARS